LGISDTDEIDPLAMGLFFERALAFKRPEATFVDMFVGKGRLREVWKRLDKAETAWQPLPCVRSIRWNARTSIAAVAKFAPASLQSLLASVPEEARAAFAKSAPEVARLWPLIEKSGYGDQMQMLARSIQGLACRVVCDESRIVLSPGLSESGVPTCRLPGQNRPAIQWSLDDVSKLGLPCVWVLEREAVKWWFPSVANDRQNTTPPEELDDWTWKMIQRGDTNGVPYIGSNATGMQDFLRRVRPDRRSDLMAVIMLHRPGPFQFADTFIARKHGEEPITYPHPALEGILRDTYGLILYQEQIIQIAMQLAGMSAAEAEQWRRVFFRANVSDSAVEEASALAHFRNLCIAHGAKPGDMPPVLDALKKHGPWCYQKAYIATCAALAWRAARLIQLQKATLGVESFEED